MKYLILLSLTGCFTTAKPESINAGIYKRLNALEFRISELEGDIILLKSAPR